MNKSSFYCVIYCSELEPKENFQIFDSYEKAECFITSFAEVCRSYPCSFNISLFVNVDTYFPPCQFMEA